ncbi:MAG: hypothetical protein US54_C0001G0026 [Candidatus Roizmanbacteria bacterium GW2011_GWA2_37_7]|uniref:Ribbon-helix-helix protein CopG domain-containing protein n=1 Tax=Candidatus Roizmanbacteria bacterium GW2011_GWA2_37_7 TaxID=1618481 RepID=A0A0G0KE76_9BACT|nr:MAG: hypothetical protein US54_C0001G0026 [Candidatus Roizmanbacteria bacterium GW2011_GWA2_37_7]
MKKLVATNIRFPEEELIMYKRIALEKGESLSNFIRVTIRQKVKSIKKQSINKRDPIFNMKPGHSGISDGAKNHDKYIYR